MPHLFLLLSANLFNVYVCAPTVERSAQSHAITIRHQLMAERRDIPGSRLAYAVDGTPADCTRLALNSELFARVVPKFDLIISGINRGDNLGLHVTYSGTVGAAREAAISGYPALATSLDDYTAHLESAYIPCARIVAQFAACILDPTCAPEGAFNGKVINVNLPGGPAEHTTGVFVAAQGQSCFFGKFAEVDAAPPKDALSHTHDHAIGHVQSPGANGAAALAAAAACRSFKVQWGAVEDDRLTGGDRWAVQRGMVAATLLSMTQDVVPSTVLAGAGNGPHARMADEGLRSLRSVVDRVASSFGIRAGGFTDAPEILAAL